MTRKRKNKPKSKAGAHTAQNQVKSTSKKDSDRMDRDVEDPQGGTRKQESSWKMFTGFIRHPSRFIDLIFSTVVRIQLFMYQRVAGRFPLFLEEKVDNYKQESTDLTLAVNELKKTKKQLSNDNESLNKTHTELLNANTTLAEDNEELEKSKQKLSDAVLELTVNTELLKNKDELFRKNKDLGDENRKLTKRIEELETTIKEQQDGNKQLKDKNTELGNNNKVLAGDIKRLEDTNNKLENKNTELTLKHAKLAESNIELNKSNNELQRKEKLQSEEIKSQQTQITKKDMNIENLTQIKEAGEYKVAMMSDQIKSLKQEVRMWQDKLTVTEAEKHDALRRLSEQVSVKLRDNNPNIVDLSDQCRPTKLAEMFSELYDNEWTNAFSVLEDVFTEEQTIVILLDTVMIAYGLCEERVNEPWQSLTDWFLDKNLPGVQQTTKWLKDSRKTNIQKKVPVIEKTFSETISSMCGDENLETLLYDNDVKIYFTKCIELCLLMVATDPPVVLVCPGWNASPSPQKNGTKTSKTSKDEKQVSEESEKENCSQVQPVKLSDNNQHTRGTADKHSADDAETSDVEELQHFTEETNQNKITELIDCNKSANHDNTEQCKDDSRQEHDQQHIRQQQNDVLMHVDTEESRSSGEPQPEDQEQHYEQHPGQDPEVKDQNDCTSHGITMSVILGDLSQPEEQDNYQEKEKEQENDDNGIKDGGELTNIQQREFQKEESDENVMKDKYENLIEVTEKDEMEYLQQTGCLDDTEAGVSQKEKQEETQDAHRIARDDSKNIEKKDAHDSQARQPVGFETLDEIKVDKDNDAAMEGNSDQEVNKTLYKPDINEGTDSLPNDTEDPPDGLMFSNGSLFDITATKEGTDDNTGEDKKVHPHLETLRNKNETNENNDEQGDSPINDQHNNGNAKAANDEMKQVTLVMVEKRPLFDKELFKEYTRRGKYLDYIVWPAMCLHKDGPVLHKGVAQGRKDQNVVQNGERWTWRSSN